MRIVKTNCHHLEVSYFLTLENCFIGLKNWKDLNKKVSDIFIDKN